MSDVDISRRLADALEDVPSGSPQPAAVVARPGTRIPSLPLRPGVRSVSDRRRARVGRRPLARTAARRRAGESWLIFVAAGCAYAASAYFLVYVAGYLAADSVWQTVQAWLLLGGDIPRLSALGPALPPLPVILAAPLQWIAPAGYSGLANGILSGFAAALTCVVLSRCLAGFGIPRRWRYLMLALFALNPVVVLYASNGSSAMLGALLATMSVHFFLAWQRTSSLKALISLGFATGLAALVRFDALAFSIVLLVALWFLASFTGRPSFERISGLLIAFYAPVLFILGAWLLYNLLIPYMTPRLVAALAAGVSQFPNPILARVEEAPSLEQATVLIAGGVAASLAVFPAFLVATTAIAADAVRTKDPIRPALLIPVWALPLLEGLGSHAQRTGGVLGQSLLIVPLGTIMVGLWAGGTPRLAFGKVIGPAVIYGSATLLLALSSVSAGFAMDAADKLGPALEMSPSWLAGTRPPQGWTAEREIAGYLNTEGIEGPILVDDEEAYVVIYFTGRPDLFAPLATVQYQDVRVEKDPRAVPAQPPRHMLVGARSASNLSGVSGYYLRTFAGELGAPSLVKEWKTSGWRLFRLPAP